MSDNFWDRVEEYRKLGFDPLRWVPSCSNEVDPFVLRGALADVKKSSVKVALSWFDPFYYMEGKTPELTRRVFALDGSAIDKEVEVKRALAVFRIHTGAGENQQLLSESLQNLLKAFNFKVGASCASAVLTEHPEAQFAMFDYIGLHRGDKAGYMPATTAATQVTDVTRPPDSDVHSGIALTSAIETLNLLGCGIPSSFKLFPIYDAPSDDILDRTRANLDAFTSRYNIAWEDYNSLKRGKLFYGATALATTTKELPTKYEQVEEGMEILLTNKFGGLPAVSLHALAQMNPENVGKYEAAGLSFEGITAASGEAIKSLSEPHFVLGKIIAKYCPDFGTPFDKGAHIAAVYPVGARGIFALGGLAESANAQLTVNELPVRQEEIARYATKESLVENSTASVNGCHLIVATKDAANLIIEDLKKHNFAPETIGSVSKKGAASVALGKDAGQYVAAKSKLARLIAPPQPAS